MNLKQKRTKERERKHNVKFCTIFRIFNLIMKLNSHTTLNKIDDPSTSHNHPVHVVRILL